MKLRRKKWLLKHFLLGFFINFSLCGCIEGDGVTVDLSSEHYSDIAIKRFSLQSKATNQLPILFEVVTDSDLDLESLSLASIVNQGSAQGVQWELEATTDPNKYILKAVSVESDGSLLPSFAEKITTDSSGRFNRESNFEGDAIDFDTKAPTKPKNFSWSHQSGVISGALPKLNWQSSSDEGSGVAYYEVQFHKAENDAVLQPWIRFDESLISLLEFNNDLHFVRVRGVDQAGNRSDYLQSPNILLGNRLFAPADTYKDIYDQFGAAIAYDDGRVVIGAPADSEKSSNSGAAFVFVKDGNNWKFEAKLLAPDDSDFIGQSVAISGDFAFVGANYDSDVATSSGAVYIFKRTNGEWSFFHKLKASDATLSDRFGYGLSVSGNTLAVGSYDDDNTQGVDAGSVYVFKYNGAAWIQQQKIIISDIGADFEVGKVVAVEDNRLVIGSPNDDDAGGGAVYVYEFNGVSWNQTAKLVASNGNVDNEFGSSVALSGNRIAIGARQSDTLGFNVGSVYIFDYDGANWIESEEFGPSDPVNSAHFGGYKALSLSNDILAVGRPLDDLGPGFKTGSAYVFEFNGSEWVEKAKQSSNLQTKDEQFGYSVCLTGDELLTGVSNFGYPGFVQTLDLEGL